MKAWPKFRPIRSAMLLVAVCFASGALAQGSAGNANNSKSSNAASSADEHPDIVEIDVFGGISMYGEVNRGLGMKLVDGGVAGLGVTWNPSRWVGLELWGDFAQANVEFRTS